jgi:hypothetical protein
MSVSVTSDSYLPGADLAKAQADEHDEAGSPASVPPKRAQRNDGV